MKEINIESLIDALDKGDVISLPTDTVDGYICDATNNDAINKIYEIKKRDNNKPLAIFVKNKDEFYKIIDGGKKAIGDDVINIIDTYWPGALTIICKKNKNVLPDFNNGLDTIAVRIPDDERILALLDRYDKPLAQTSANISGEGAISSKEGSKESTIIDITHKNIKVVREGMIKI